MARVLGKGAEATVTLEKGVVTKDRTPKRYRHPALDTRLRGERTRAEARILRKARVAGVPVPRIIDEKGTTLTMDMLRGARLVDVLDARPTLAQRIGTHVARLHDAGIIHGDLTTSNMLLVDDEVFLIDFGLAFHSIRDEDKAVDLHLLRQALGSRHHRVATRAYRAFLKGYRASAHADAVLARLVTVEARGRNKGS